MTSRLELIPRDILQGIAVLVGSSSPLHPPVDFLSFLLSSSTINRSLSLNYASHVYASIFSSKFDSPSILDHHRIWTTNSGLSHELVNRLRLLQRSCRRDLSPEGLLQDLWTAYWMICESKTRNECQLVNVDFAGFILAVARRYLHSAGSDHGLGCTTIKHLIVWLLTLSLSRRTLRELSPKDRDELKDLILPYMYLFKRVDPTAISHWGNGNSSTSCDCCHAIEKQQEHISPSTSTSLDFDHSSNAVHVRLYGQKHAPHFADPSFFVIALFCALKELFPLAVPKHLPSRRRSSSGQPFRGLAREDVAKMAAYETPLFADSVPDAQFSSAEAPLDTSLPRGMRDGVLLYQTLSAFTRAEKSSYILGSMTGLWEGEYFTISELCIRNRRYQKFSSVPPETSSGAPDPATRHSIPKNEKHSDTSASVVLMGETLEEHDHAWGGYVFSGTADQDGLIRLRRVSVQLLFTMTSFEFKRLFAVDGYPTSSAAIDAGRQAQGDDRAND
ncbi:hypothetical protein CVT24_010088 [Panaeolus cyanescens]|uniref:Uncharacterized protein n=1 Tax=Panaeolus cyanescens TaxID=181874 RepID=A0A409YQ23_9AGAR|nr:hypothetical protein CVT24_010088 [Panaeolus cyanescens]